MARGVKAANQSWGPNKYGMQIGAVVRRLCREADFFNKVAEWMREDLRNMPPPLLIRLLEYGYGKPPERIEVASDFTEDNRPVDFSQMSEEEALAKQEELIVAMLQKIRQKRDIMNAIPAVTDKPNVKAITPTTSTIQ